MSLTDAQLGSQFRALVKAANLPTTTLPEPIPVVVPVTGTVGIVVPLYTHPTNWVSNGPVIGTWAELKKQALLHPSVVFIAIVNPASGVGSADSPEYSKAIHEFDILPNVRVLGYVATGYRRALESDVKKWIDTWYNWYPEIDGIFFDEEDYRMGGSAYYYSLTSYTKLKKAGAITVGNPGADTLPEYLTACDVTIIYESPGLPTLTNYKAKWDSYENAKLGFIPYGIKTIDSVWLRQAASLAGWIYMTDDVLANPWDSLPTYFSQLCNLIDQLS